MAETKTRISQELTPEQLEAFCLKLKDVPHGDLAKAIQKLAAEDGIVIGLSAAYGFKNNELMPFLKRLQERKLKAQMIREAGADDDSGATLADAAGAEVSQMLFDFVSELDGQVDITTKEGRAILKEVTNAIAKLRSGDRAMIKQMREQLVTIKASVAEMSDPEKAADPDFRQRILDEVDIAMGIKKK